MKFSIKQHLIGLVLIAIIPVVFFAARMVQYLAEERARSLHENLLGTTRILNSSVDEQIVSVMSSLQILAETEEFRPDTIQYLHSRLSRFVKSHKDISYISLVDTRGVQVFNTSRPFGRKLPVLRHQPYFREMTRKQTTVLSGFQREEKSITVIVPVKQQNVLIYALMASLPVDSFSKLLGSQQLPQGWSAILMDPKATILAHSQNPEHFVGRTATNRLSEKLNWRESLVFTDVSKKGDSSFGATSHSRITGWTMVLRVPDDGHLFTYWKSMHFIIGGGAFFVLLGIGLALLLSRRISKPILQLSRSAHDLGQGREVAPLKTSLREVNVVAEALRIAANERHQHEQKIQEAVKVRDTFLSVASHELKTPITTLNLQTSMLDRLTKDKETVATADLVRPFTRIKEQTRRLLMLIDDLLDVTKISAGKMEYRPEVFDLVTFLNDVTQQLETEAQKAGSNIFFSAPEKLIGMWDRHRLEQVIVNLLTNAIKYGNGTPILVEVSEADGKALVSVRDHGIGISPEDLGKIFDRYERVGDTRKISGLGLGLWIVQKIVEGLGGSISVTSTLGEGSTFLLNLPLPAEKLEAQGAILQLNLLAEENVPLS